jgi:hypothetical protein
VFPSRQSHLHWPNETRTSPEHDRDNDLYYETSVTRRIGRRSRNHLRQCAELLQARQGCKVIRLRLPDLRYPPPESTTSTLTLGEDCRPWQGSDGGRTIRGGCSARVAAEASRRTRRPHQSQGPGKRRACASKKQRSCVMRNRCLNSRTLHSSRTLAWRRLSRSPRTM